MPKSPRPIDSSVPRYRIFRWSITQRLAILLAVATLVVAITLVLFVGFLMESRSPATALTAPQAPADEQQADERTPPSLASIISQHRAATGLGNVRSLTLRGTITLEDGNPYNCTFIIRRPHYLRQAVRNFRISASLAFNGDSYTAMVNGVVQPTGNNPNRVDSELNRNSILIEGAFGQLAWGSADPAQGPVLVGGVTFNDTPCFVIDQPMAGRAIIRYFIDQHTFQEVGRRLRFMDGETPVELEMHLSAVRSEEGITLPMHYLLFRDGLRVVSASFESVTPNAGLLSEAFE